MPCGFPRRPVGLANRRGAAAGLALGLAMAIVAWIALQPTVIAMTNHGMLCYCHILPWALPRHCYEVVQ